MLFVVATQQWVVATFNITSKIKSFKQRILYKKNLSSQDVKSIKIDI